MLLKEKKRKLCIKNVFKVDSLDFEEFLTRVLKIEKVLIL